MTEQQQKQYPVFDGHNDVLLRILRQDGVPDPVESFFHPWPGGHLDEPRIKAGNFLGGFFALYVSPPEKPDDGKAVHTMRKAPYRHPLPPALDLDYSQKFILREVSLLLRIERTHAGRFAIVKSVADILKAKEEGKIAAVFHMEGADAVDPDLEFLDVLYAAGLRSLGPVWSRPTIFAEGVPFAFPSSPDTGPGLTDAGKALVRRCNELKIMLDLSHLNEKGFWDIAALSDSPLVASHSNAHAVCASSRNLTDRQLDAIRDSKGMVGINFSTSFLREDGETNPATSLEQVIRHFDYMIEHMGVDHVGMGSDFDGATIPESIGDVTGVQKLLAAMRAHGYDEPTLEKLAYKNWLAVLERVWGA
ncbi:MAG: dipeptidase [Methylobacteriaceae bacterium]|jgi:membrane dipeptidase|nr:dipeptidase [Methylobacteriaceae bacterium]